MSVGDLVGVLVMYVRGLHAFNILLVIEETSNVKEGFEPGGATGVQETAWLSLDRARVPSFFL